MDEQSAAKGTSVAEGAKEQFSIEKFSQIERQLDAIEYWNEFEGEEKFSATNEDGKNALMIALENGFANLAEIILSPLARGATSEDRKDYGNVFSGAGQDFEPWINQQSKTSGDTALMIAIKTRQFDIVKKILLKSSLDFSIKNNSDKDFAEVLEDVWDNIEAEEDCDDKKDDIENIEDCARLFKLREMFDGVPYGEDLKLFFEALGADDFFHEKEESLKAAAAQNVPNKIFYIAISKLPKQYLQNMLEVSTNKPQDFEVALYVDDEKIVRQTLGESGVGEYSIKSLQIKNIAEIFAKLDLCTADEIRDSSKKKLRAIVEQEMTGNRNLAAASDILRLIELLDGGYYLDWDIEPKKSADEEFLFQGFKMKQDDVSCNNNALASTPKHPVLLFVLDRVIPAMYDAVLSKEITDKKFSSIGDLKRSSDTRLLQELLPEDERYTDFAGSDRMRLVSMSTGPIMLSKVLEYCEEKFGVKLFFKDPNIAGFNFNFKCDLNWKGQPPVTAFDNEFRGDPKDRVANANKKAREISDVKYPVASNLSQNSNDNTHDGSR